MMSQYSHDFPKRKINMIRAMTVSDLPAVFDIRVAVKENTITLERLSALGITLSSLADALKTGTKGWVFVVESEAVGFVLGNGRNGEVEVLAVLPGQEGKGIGAALMTAVQGWLFSLGHQQLTLKTTPNKSFRAYGFYQGLGWRPTGEFDGEDEKFVLSR